MSYDTSFDQGTGERFPASPRDTSHAGGRVIALAMPFVLQACSGAAPARPPARAPTDITMMASSDDPGDGARTGAGDQDAGGPGVGAPHAPVVRISLGSYPPEREHEVASLLDYKNRSIGEDIQRLGGLVWYYSGIDRERHAIVNVSLWRDVPSAEQMSKLQAMLDLGAEMSRLGVQFVRPIPNFEPVWTFTGAAP